jgi:hypothetical protein
MQALINTPSIPNYKIFWLLDMYLEKPKRFIIWNEGSTSYNRIQILNLFIIKI